MTHYHDMSRSREVQVMCCSALENGKLELDNNICERSIKPVTLGRKNYLVMGSKGGGHAAAVAYTLIET